MEKELITMQTIANATLVLMVTLITIGVVIASSKTPPMKLFKYLLIGIAGCITLLGYAVISL